MKLNRLAASAVAIAIAVGTAGPALAHVTTDPATASKGGEITLGFRVPNERDDASTTQVEVDMDVAHPILGIMVQPLPGWTARASTRSLNPPIQTDDGPITQAVSQVIWSGGTIGPGQFQEFRVLAQQLPKDTDHVIFKVLQTYANGDVVRWIDPVQAGQKAPDHPAPTLALTAPASDSQASRSSSSVPQVALDTARLATKSSVDSARTIALLGLVVGVVGLLGAVWALLSRPNRRA